VALRLGPLRIPWPGKAHADDPYWDHFIHAAPADMANSVVQMIRNAPDGNLFPVKADLHTPEISSSHVKELALYCGADLVGIAALENDPDGYPFGIVTAVRADQDPRETPGIGGQVPAQNELYVTFVMSAWVRELGYRATDDRATAPDREEERLAAKAGLGTLNAEGRLVTRKYGTRIHVGNVIRTDLPLAPDG
jgi:hypothetical protein